MVIKRQALILIMMLGLFFMQSSSAQKVTVTDQKGTKIAVNNTSTYVISIYI